MMNPEKWNRLFLIFNLVFLTFALPAFIMAVMQGTELDKQTGRLLGVTEDLDRIKRLIQDIEVLDNFEETMKVIENKMKYYIEHKEELENPIIITDFIGFGHFSWPRQFEEYEHFLRLSGDLKLVIVDSVQRREVLKKFVSPKIKNREDYKEKIKEYLEKYYTDAFPELKTGDSPLYALNRRQKKANFLDKANYEKTDRPLIMNSIMATEKYLQNNIPLSKNTANFIEASMAPSIQIWYFNKNDAIFAIIEETGESMAGFKSEHKQLNEALRSAATSIWEHEDKKRNMVTSMK